MNTRDRSIVSTTGRGLSRKGGTMPRCGACGWHFSSEALTKHAFTACGEEDSKAPSRRHLPELDDLVRQAEEDEANA